MSRLDEALRLGEELNVAWIQQRVVMEQALAYLKRGRTQLAADILTRALLTDKLLTDKSGVIKAIVEAHQ